MTHVHDSQQHLPLQPSTPQPQSSNSLQTGARRPRAQSMQQFSEKPNAIPRDCSSGSFVSKLYRMVDSEPASIVSWIRGGTAFCIVDPKMMAEHCLPKYFRHRRFSSLIRQLNFYSFYRVQEGQLTIYQHSFFRKGRPDLLVHIKRRGAGKAKDPWFDPLAHTKPTTNSTLLLPNHPTYMNPMPLHNMTMNKATCFSPMSNKPMNIKNMSPALKPGISPQIAPPTLTQLSNDEVKWDFTIDELSQNVGDNQVKQEIDIQTFLTDDCSLNADSLVDRSTNIYNSNLSALSQQVQPQQKFKYASVVRDCLKWDEPLTSSESSSFPMKKENDTFEEALLLDLANIEPGTWDVPLSPLNEEEDMLPWLDLCF